MSLKPQTDLPSLLPMPSSIALRASHHLRIAYTPAIGDAHTIAQVVLTAQQQQHTSVLVCASAQDAVRLTEELTLFMPNVRIRMLPDWETLPYDKLSPHPDLVSERLATLFQALQNDIDCLVLSASTAVLRLPPPSHLAGHTFLFKTGDTLNIEKLRTQLITAGYHAVSQVVSPGEYCIRGNLVDLFATGTVLPYRIDLFDDSIDNIKTFDVDTQRSLYPVPEIRLLPGREYPTDEASRNAFRSRWRSRFEGDPNKVALYRDIGHGVAAAGIEYYLPLFFEETCLLPQYLGQKSYALMLHGDVPAALEQFTQDTKKRFDFLSKDTEHPILNPSEIYASAEGLFQAFEQAPRIQFSTAAQAIALPIGTLALPNVAADRKQPDPLHALKNICGTLSGQFPQVLITANSPGRRETLLQYLNEHHIQPTVYENLYNALNAPKNQPWLLTTAILDRGFALVNESQPLLAVVTEAELFSLPARKHKHNRHSTDRTSNVDAMIRDLSELKVGDPVVHQQHGIGRYQGLINMDLGDGESEFLQLEYAQATKLFVPVSQLHVIARYSGADPENAPLHTMGSGQWEKAKKKTAILVRDAAAELLNLYAKRAMRQGHGFKLNPTDYAAFAEGFGFEETPDQAVAIQAVINDMLAPRPMDRLVCGDVGFGKTEVALRAAFISVMDGKQVVLLAPTTLLAEQHFQTFSDRFAEWPVKVVELSRFRSAKEIRQNIELINQGKADIIIGTHSVLRPDIEFSRLGLVIIDEEHRFGVRHKEMLKNLRAEVDVLTLTATPIPRTLAMSMEGIRDFSVIATAPQRRLAIKTFVREESDSVMREAILRELKRGGQVYFLHNEIDTIDNRLQSLAQLIPEARIAIAHGQMNERDLERVMRDFYQQRFNVLLCTTIIETGIDIPSANTIIIHRADKFGLAQLHQLRGRVGRSHHQAYAYLLVHNTQGISKNATRRLEAIAMMEELGSGFYLAMHDLEIRGAGEVLGDHQSGNVHEVGFQMYTDMLNQAVRSLKNGQEPDLTTLSTSTIDIRLHSSALLPADYCPDVHQRLSLYKRLASANSANHLNELQEELIDRFGPLPDAARALLETHRLRLEAERIGIIKIDSAPMLTQFQFAPQPNVDAGRIIHLIQQSRDMKLAGPDKLRIERKLPDLADRVSFIKGFCKSLNT